MLDFDRALDFQVLVVSIYPFSQTPMLKFEKPRPNSQGNG
ncbi:hypothetical protein BofuT4_P083900.1 [Botrytis cinerea T4]|uniref:Uncharacterized protein n=1 Tax=Botryotinia fuckeliana (strain T4) TaxID=999810 RepID=G2YJS0_BOTF4|nr:hypothetical protein BofuT4_P083900.1 [Botrytis cinerea T4]